MQADTAYMTIVKILLSQPVHIPVTHVAKPVVATVTHRTAQFRCGDGGV